MSIKKENLEDLRSNLGEDELPPEATEETKATPKKVAKKKATTKKKAPAKKTTPKKAPAKKKAVAKKTTTKKAPAKKAASTEGMITLAAICDELGIKPSAARRKLRADDSITKDGGWKWKDGSRDHKAVVKLLGGN